MNFNSVPILQAMKQKMQYASERQAVLAANVANADTPEYKARDLREPDFRKQLAGMFGKLPLARTNPAHMTGIMPGDTVYRSYVREHPDEVNPNGNTVSIESEIQRLSMNGADYQQVTALYRKTTGMFKTALGQNASS